jgi:hypothetical protein
MIAEVFVFTPSCIDWPSHTTVVTNIKEQQNTAVFGWNHDTLCLMLSMIAFLVEPSKHAKNIKFTRQKLMKMEHMKYFNPSFLNKWRVHKLLDENADLSCYLPQTKQLDPENLLEMLERHKTVFIKPSNGSLGKGIVKAWKKRDTGMIYGIHGARRSRHIKVRSVQEFLNKIASVTQSKPYIVQEGIDLININIRILISGLFPENGQGEWIISKKFCPGSGPKSSISNLSSGGRSERSVLVLRHIFQSIKASSRKKTGNMARLCTMVAHTLEANSGKIFGELGLDIGIDKKGRLWLIEVNSKPRKTTQTEMSQKIVYNTFSRPWLTQVHLAGF